MNLTQHLAQPHIPKRNTSTIGWALTIIVYSFLHGSTVNAEDRITRILDDYPRAQYADLIERHQAELDDFFSWLPAAARVRQFMEQEDTQGIYEELLIRVIEDALHGDMLEGMFMGMFLEITPPPVLIRAVVPHLKPVGRLEGMLEQSAGSPVVQRMQRQLSPSEEPNFRQFASYLVDHYHRDPAPFLVKHMFRTDPGQAFYVMMSAEFSHRYPARVRDNEALLKPLFWAEHVVSDAIWKKEHAFDEAFEEASPVAMEELDKLSQHEQWWVRLYVAEILHRQPELGTPEMVSRLEQDRRSFVREAITREQGGRTARPGR